MEILDKKTDIGRFRECNEDSITFIRHPKNKNYKLLALADGMGGKEFGNIASSFTINKINKWYISKDIKTLNDNNKVINLIARLVRRINKELIDKFGKDTSGTTLTLALINKKNTIIFNCGDSRAYIYKKNVLEQITEDDSDVWLYHKYNHVNKEWLRYISSSNIINACIGINNDLCKLRCYILDNTYDMLFLFSDGVTDLLTDKKISKIIKKNKKEDILSKIIHNSVNVNQHLRIPRRLKKDLLNVKLSVPVTGRDNASGVAFIKEGGK